MVDRSRSPHRLEPLGNTARAALDVLYRHDADPRIANQQAIIMQLRRQLVAKDALIAAQETVIASKVALIAAQAAMIEDTENEIALKDTVIEEKDNVIASLRLGNGPIAPILADIFDAVEHDRERVVRDTRLVRGFVHYFSELSDFDQRPQ